MLPKTCGTCAIYISQQATCQLMPSLQGKIKPTDFCSQHKDYIETCELCGGGLLDVYISVDPEGKAHTYCSQCVLRLS